MQVVELKLSQIHVDKDWNVREARNYGDIDSLASLIASEGQRTPIEVGPATPEGKHPVITGFRRVAAVRKLSRETGQEHHILAVIVDKEEAEKAWLNLTENLAREDLTTFERAKGLARLVNDFGWTEKDIAKRFGASDKDDGKEVKGLSEPNVRNLVSGFNKLSPKCLEAWSKDLIKVEAVNRIKAKDHEEQDDILPYIKGKSGDKLLQAIEEYEAGADAPSVAEDTENTKKKRAKPGPATVRKALAWAKEGEHDDVVAVLKWVLGQGGKKLKVAGQEFDPKAKDTDEVDDN